MVTILVFTFAASWASTLGAETLDRVLAVVAGDVITLSDVNAAYELGLVTPQPSATDPVRDVLSQLIDRELQLTEVERFAPPEPTTEAVDQAVETVRARFPTPGALDAVFARWGIDVQHLRQTLRENLRIKAYIDQRFAMSGDRRQQLVDDWLAGLRRRAEIIDLYVPEK